MTSPPLGVRPSRCPACGHDPSPPREDGPLRRRLRRGPAAPGCSWADNQIGLRIADCTCRNAWHAG